MPYVFKIDDDSISTAKELAKYYWTDDQATLKRDARDGDFRTENCFKAVNINELQPLIFAGHSTRRGGEICFGNWNAAEFADKFLTDFVKQYGDSTASKLKITELLFVGCELGLPLNQAPALAQQMADALFDRGFTNATVRAVAAPVTNEKNPSMIVEVIEQPGYEGAINKTASGFISAYFFNDADSQQHDELDQEHKKLQQRIIVKPSNKSQEAELTAVTESAKRNKERLQRLQNVEGQLKALKQKTRFLGDPALNPKTVFFKQPQNIFKPYETPEQRRIRIAGKSSTKLISSTLAPVLTATEDEKTRAIRLIEQQIRALQAAKVKQSKIDRLISLAKCLRETKKSTWKDEIANVSKHFKDENKGEYRTQVYQLLLGLCHYTPVVNQAPPQKSPIPVKAPSTALTPPPIEHTNRVESNDAEEDILDQLREDILKTSRLLNSEMTSMRGNFLVRFFWQYEINTKQTKFDALNNLANSSSLAELRSKAENYKSDPDSRVMRNWRKTGRVVDLIDRILQKTKPYQSIRHGMN